MPERQSRHPDNDLIDSMSDAPGPQSSSGGGVARDVGKRDELKQVLEGENTERVRGSDNPQADARKGDKTLSHMQDGGN
ncbi:hypothetical protein [Novosphingobium aquimarinum]|uniref:hypothetical protein n=1 Tax=Novosphingobium aquimarinum TaxID=2682494 RepID=UPI0012EBDF21|nr:hypothetical protein [Novosphingobium aquimarinum]